MIVWQLVMQMQPMFGLDQPGRDRFPPALVVHGITFIFRIVLVVQNQRTHKFRLMPAESQEQTPAYDLSVTPYTRPK